MCLTTCWTGKDSLGVFGMICPVCSIAYTFAAAFAIGVVLLVLLVLKVLADMANEIDADELEFTRPLKQHADPYAPVQRLLPEVKGQTNLHVI